MLLQEALRLRYSTAKLDIDGFKGKLAQKAFLCFSWLKI